MKNTQTVIAYGFQVLAKRTAAQRAAQCEDPEDGFDHFFVFPNGSPAASEPMFFITPS